MERRLKQAREKRKNSQGRDPSTQERNSQGKDPRTFEGNSQGGDISTLKTNSQGKDPRTFREPVERWRVQKKRKEKSVRKRRNEKEGELQKKALVEKVQRKDRKPLHGEDKRGKERKGRHEETQTTQSETSLGEIWLAVCQRCSRRIAEKDGDDGKGGSSRKFK